MNFSKLTLVLLIMILPTINQAQVNFNPPKTEQQAVVDDLHGFKLTDPFQWEIACTCQCSTG